MTYDLAKKLKEAGFPQREDLIEREIEKIPLEGVGYHLLRENANSPDYYAVNDRTMYLRYWNPEYIKGDGARYIVYIPILSELIGACGDKFSFLMKRKAFKDGNLDGWRASAEIGDADFVERTGPTPEEAVANLWLELNKK